MSRAALVTGASRGIGEAVAERLAASGHDLTVSARSREPLEALAKRLNAKHGVKVEVAVTDMSVEDDVRRLAAVHQAAHGRADVVVLNAGMGSIGPIESFPVRRLDKMFAINVRSAVVLVQDLLPSLRSTAAQSDGGARVIAVASVTGLVGTPMNSAYGATKAALISWCETLNAEESGAGVLATAVCPGYVATAMTEGLADQVPLDSMLPVADVAEMVAGLTRLSGRTVVPALALTRPGAPVWRV